MVAPILYAQRLDGVGPAASVAPDIPGVVKDGKPVELLLAGPDKKPPFVVGAPAIWRIQMESQGFAGRAK